MLYTEQMANTLPLYQLLETVAYQGKPYLIVGTYRQDSNWIYITMDPEGTRARYHFDEDDIEPWGASLQYTTGAEAAAARWAARRLRIRDQRAADQLAEEVRQLKEFRPGS